MCKSGVESHNHIFCQCSFTTLVLDQIMTAVGVSYRCASLTDCIDFFSSSGHKKSVVYRIKSAGFCFVLNTI